MPPNATKELYDNGKSDEKQLVSREWLRERAKTDTWSAMDHLIWFNIAWFVGLHAVSAYGIYLLVTFQVKLLTILFAVVLYHISLFGITAGVHRLWSHRAYKARAPFRFLLVLMNSVAYQNSVYVWARDHRVHHKYSETNADPVNIERGFFFAHCGWLLCKKHPDVRDYGGRVDMSDIIADPFVYWQHQYYIPSVVLLCIALPTVLPWYLWGESFWISYVICFVLRYTLALNSTWLVNSAAHVFGNRPYDVNIAPTENKIVAGLTLGEGYHNYHHTFPWDYSTSEWGWNTNFTTIVLDQLSKIGMVYDRRSATKELIKARKERTGNSKKYVPVELGY